MKAAKQDANRPGRDVTNAEALARERLREIEDIYRNAPVGLCVLDRELRFVRINERMVEINGLPAAEHLGKRLRDVLPELADTADSGLRHVLETGEPCLNIEITGTTPARPGVQRSWLEQWLPIRDVAGRVAGLNIVAEETTARKQAERDLRAANEELIRFNKAMVGRELRMIALKKEINALLAKENKAPKYKVPEEESPWDNARSEEKT